MEQYTQQVEQCIAIALKCVDPDRVKRPTAEDIIQGLTAADQVWSAFYMMPYESFYRNNLHYNSTSICTCIKLSTFHFSFNEKEDQDSEI